MPITEAQKQFMADFEKDYSDESDKPLLKPRNNREYWLFTEIHQRLTDFFKEKTMTVEELATAVGENPKTIRRYLKKDYPGQKRQMFFWWHQTKDSKIKKFIDDMFRGEILPSNL